VRARIEQRIVAGDLAGAAAICAEAPGAFASLTLARIAYLEGRTAEARRHLAHARKDASMLAPVGNLYEALGSGAAAVDCWRRAGAHEKLHAWHRARGNEEAARRHLSADPEADWAIAQRAAEAFAEGRWDDALALYRRLSDPFSAYACGEIELRRGEEAAAAFWYRRAVNRGAPSGWPHCRLAMLALKAGRPREGLRWLDEAPGEGLEEMRAHLRLAAGDPDAAPMPEVYETRLRDIEAGRCVLHADRRAWPTIALRVCGAEEWRPVVDACVAFHARTFGRTSPMRVASWTPLTTTEGYDFFANAISHQRFEQASRALGVPQRRQREVLLVLLPGVGALSRGYGGYGHAVIECVADDAYLPAVLAHELYHAILRLQHTDGEKDRLELSGLMGTPGSLTRLEDAHLSFRQRAHAATPHAVQSLVNAGWRADRATRWDRAAALYRRALEGDPLHLWVASRLAQAEMHRGDYSAAARVLHDALYLDNGADLAAQLGHVLIDLGRLAEARAALARGRGYGHAERTHVLAGVAWARSLHPARAAREFRRALSLDPGSGEAHAHLGAALHCLGRFREARRAYDRALQVDPRWAEVLDRLAILHAEEGDFEGAARHSRAAGRNQPDAPEHLHALARLRMQEGRWEAVPTTLGRVLARRRHAQAPRLYKAYAHLVLGDRDPALAEFDACVLREPRSPWARMAFGWRAVLRGEDLPPHLSPLRRIDGRDRRCAPLVHLLAALHERLGSPAEADACWDRLFALIPRHPWVR